MADLLWIIGRRVFKFRKEREWSQERLSFESGLHRAYISGVETGERNPTAKTLAKLAKALRVSPADLLPGHTRWTLPD